MKNLRLLLSIALVSIMAFGIALLPSGLALAQKEAVCDGIALTGTGGGCAADDSAINNVIAQVINILSMVVGVVAVIMIIIGGFKYITSAGDSSKVGSAKNTILYAIVGLVIVALAQFIVRFVMSRI